MVRWYHLRGGRLQLRLLGNPPGFNVHPVPKISYPDEEQALHAVHNIMFMANSNNLGATVDLSLRGHPSTENKFF